MPVESEGAIAEGVVGLFLKIETALRTRLGLDNLPKKNFFRRERRDQSYLRFGDFPSIWLPQ
jgi:hypothetical protein